MNGIDRMAQELEALEASAGEQGWGGEFREEMFDEMLRWLKSKGKRRSLGLLLTHLLSTEAAADARRLPESGL